MKQLASAGGDGAQSRKCADVALKGMVRGHGGARLRLLSSIIFPMRMVTALSAIHGVWGRWQ